MYIIIYFIYNLYFENTFFITKQNAYITVNV